MSSFIKDLFNIKDNSITEKPTTKLSINNKRKLTSSSSIKNTVSQNENKKDTNNIKVSDIVYEKNSNNNINNNSSVLNNSSLNQYDTKSNIQKEFNLFIESLNNKDINLQDNILNNNTNDEYKYYTKEKRDYLISENNKKKIILQELSQINYSNPITLINSKYLNEEYDKDLLIEQIQPTENNHGNKVNNSNIEFINLVTSKVNLNLNNEKLIFINKILTVFLNYYVKKNFNLIVSSLNKLYFIESNLITSTKLVSKIRSKQSTFKKAIIINKCKFLLLKQKSININVLLSISKNIMLNIKSKLSNTNSQLLIADLQNNKDFSKYIEGYKLDNNHFEKLISIKEEIKDLIETYRSLNNKITKHSFLILENIMNMIKLNVDLIKHKMELYLERILNKSLNTSFDTNYTNYFFIFLNLSNFNADLYINVRQLNIYYSNLNILIYIKELVCYI